MSEKAKKQDRRTRYTRQTIKDRIVKAEKFYENYSYRGLQKC